MILAGLSNLIMPPGPRTKNFKLEINLVRYVVLQMTDVNTDNFLVKYGDLTMGTQCVQSEWYPFSDCILSAANEDLATENDVITLASPGRKYFCGVAAHCKEGQKLAITVWHAMNAPAPAPNSANGTATSGF